MRKQFCKGDFFFSSLCELGPKLRYAPVEVNLMLLQNVEDTRAADSFRSRPHQNQRVGFPGPFAASIAKSAVKIEDWSSVLPDRNRSAKLAKFFKILLEQRHESLAKLIGIQLHHWLVNKKGWGLKPNRPGPRGRPRYPKIRPVENEKENDDENEELQQ